MNSIGGYIGLELGAYKNNFFKNKLLFNSGRSACVYYLRQKGIKHIWVPYYICGDFIETLRKNDIDVNLYHLDKDLEIKADIGVDEAILYVNYFGCKEDYIKKISDTYSTLIIDNSQAFFNKQIGDLPTFYSVRKFFGVPDGGILMAEEDLTDPKLDDYQSHEYCQHLIKQLDVNSTYGYTDFRNNEERIIAEGLYGMSKLSKQIMGSFDLELVKEKRLENFSFLKKHLEDRNQFKLSTPSLFHFPFMTERAADLRTYLVKNNIYTPMLWADQLPVIDATWEKQLIENIVHLPIDQRYGLEEMEYIVDKILEFYA